MTDEKREEMLGDLEAMDAKFEMIGSYPELVAEAKLWDGDESKFADPVAMYLERVEAMQSESLQEEQDRKAAEEATPMFSWSLTPSRARAAWNGRVAGKDVQRVVDFNGVPVDLAVSSRVGEKGGDALRRVVAGDYRDELERWKQEALSVLRDMVGKKKWNDVEQHVRAGKATMDVVKRAIADGKIAPLPKQGVKVSDEELRALHHKRIVYFEKRKGEVLDLLEGVMGVRSVDESKLSSSVYFNTPYGKVRLSDHAEPMGTGHAVSTVLDLRYDMSDAEVLAAAEGMKNAQGGTLSWSLTPIYQANIIADLRKDSSLDGFMNAVDKVELSKKREFGHDDIVFGELSDDDVEKLMAQNPGWPDKYNLKGAKHSIDEKHIWHTYRGHCLDYYRSDDGLNLTYDDIRLLPDILKNYDSVTPDFKDGAWGIVYIKNYGGIEYRYSARIGKPHRRSGKAQNIRLVSGRITKKAVNREALTRQQPQATSASRFHRTAIVTPMEEYIKQNYAEEAKKIAEYAKKHDITLHAPNGMITNLTPVQWLAVRLQSFKDWFGDWENDPANASKVVDENGEPLVVYHGTRSDFTVFDVDGRGKTEGSGAFFTSDKRVAEGYSANFHTGGVTPEVYACFLNIREPEVIDFNGNSWNRVPDRASGYFVHYDNGESEWFSNKADANFAVSDYEGKAEIEEDWEESPTLDDFAREVWEEYPDVDGIIAKNVVDTAVGASKSYTATDFIVASPNQIKSATDNRGTFDGNNPDITYSVIGPKAATWSKYVDRAFTGRDDGMWRAEIDASGAKLKWEDLRGKNVTAYRRMVAGWDKLPEDVRKAVEAYAEEVYDWQEESDKLNRTPESEFLEQYNKVQKMRDAIKPKREEMRSLLNKLFVEHGGGAAAVLNMKDGELDELAMSLWGPYVEDKVEKLMDMQPLWHGGMRLADVMDYPELYEAYPELADVVVRYSGMETAYGRAIYGNGEPEIQINRNLEGVWEKIHSILLHEIQHHIQYIEGFGSNLYVCPTPAVMQMVGARAYDIVLSPDVLVKCLDENIASGVGKTLKELYPKEKRRHSITVGTMEQLPSSLAEPVCIMVSDTPGCVEVVTELKEKADNILVAVQLNALREGSRVLKVNRIVSLYGKEHITNLLGHPCLYWDKAKARIWTGGGGLQSSTAPYPKRASGRKILKPADLVKYKKERNLSFSLTGAAAAGRRVLEICLTH